MRGFPEMGLEPNLKRNLSLLSRQGWGMVVRYYRHRGRGAKAHSTASTSLQAAVKGAQEVERRSERDYEELSKSC